MKIDVQWKKLREIKKGDIKGEPYPKHGLQVGDIAAEADQ